MEPNYVACNTPQFRMLSDDQVYKIHLATLDVLENVGVRVMSEDARHLLADGGCKLCEDGIVKIPGHVVEECIRVAPKRFTLYNRNGEVALRVQHNNVYFGTGVTCPSTIDPYTGEKRPTEVADIARAAQVSDALPNLDWIMPLGSVQDVPAAVADVYEFEAAVSNTTKPICFICNDARGVADVFEMAAAIAGGWEALQSKPFIVSYPEPASPLLHTQEAVEKLLFTAEKGLPVIYTPCTQAGSTAPMTVAGALVTTNAETLSGLVMAQLKQPGTPFTVGGVLTVLDLRTAALSYGAPELSVLMAGYADLARYYKLPTWGTAGCSDAKVCDEQAAIESTFSCLMNALAGHNLVHDPGFLENGLIASLEMLVMTDEIVGMVKRLLQGIRVDDETLALDVIANVGPGPGSHFLAEKHTKQHMKTEYWTPTLMDRLTYDAWAKQGSKRMGERVKEKLHGILEAHTPEPLPDDVAKAVREIREKSERERLLSE